MLYIKETAINRCGGYQYGETDWYETFTDDPGKLYRYLRKEYGGGVRTMYRDLPNGQAEKIGWVFQGHAHYDDSPLETYEREVWVEVSTTKPKKICKIENITSPWEAACGN